MPTPLIKDAPTTISHLIDPDEKDSDWGARVMEEYYLYGGAQSMLSGKKAWLIDRYYSGHQPVNKYRKMFKRMAKQIEAVEKTQETGGIVTDMQISDLTGIDWEPLGLLPAPMNAAHSIIQKMPLYVKATAIDALAQEKKKKDYDYIKNRPQLDGQLQDVGAKLKINIASPAAQNNAESADISNFDLNPARPDELNFYFTMFHKLRPESAFEALLLALAYTQQLKDIRDLEAKDHLKYGCSANRAYFSDITGLPMAEYVWPGNTWIPPSDLADYHDVPFKYIQKDMTMEQMQDAFGKDCTDDEAIEIFDKYFEHRKYNFKWRSVTLKERKRLTVPVCYMEFKSWDTINFHKKKSKTGGYMINEVVPYSYRLQYSNGHTDPTLRGKPKKATEEEFINQKYVQNTYCGYWLDFRPVRVYKWKKLEGSYREAGRESMSPFSIKTYKSQDRGPVELCIPLVDDAQRAYFKMQHCIIMSRPKGMFLDMKYFRNAAANLASTDLKLSMNDLWNLYADNNLILGDSEGMDPMEQQSGARPFYEIEGGVGKELEGYILAINDAAAKIGDITGTRGLTANAPNPEGLVGIQKLQLQSSLNTVYYLQNAMRHQTEAVFHTWAPQAQFILKHRGTASYMALEQIVGTYKVAVLEDLHTIPSHQFGIMVENVPTEEEQAELNQILLQMLMRERITTSDFVTLRRVFNWKDAQQLLAIRERKQKELRQAEQAAQLQGMLQARQMDNQTKLQAVSTSSQGEVQEEVVKADSAKWLAAFQAKVEFELEKLRGAVKDQLQDKRMRGQIDKARTNASVQAQKPII